MSRAFHRPADTQSGDDVDRQAGASAAAELPTAAKLDRVVVPAHVLIQPD